MAASTVLAYSRQATDLIWWPSGRSYMMALLCMTTIFLYSDQVLIVTSAYKVLTRIMSNNIFLEFVGPEFVCNRRRIQI